ncbi:MAG: ABC transporter ATP-binding protein [Chloroflexi bacterium]|nr:ABC transporter ATP-binding protein [Chloroflexota bacterium]
MNDTIVELRKVSKWYGTVLALREVSLQVRSGEVLAVLGPNGAGKSTSIALMLGLRRPTSGEARLFGLDPRDRRGRGRIGVMLQESGVPPTLRVRELLDLFRSYYPKPRSTDELLDRAGLRDQAKAPIGNLSGGQKQRVYFALAICGSPEVVFLDEPTTALDVESRRMFWEQIREFVRAGTTIILTTHNLDEADALASRIVVINHGQIIADGTPGAIKARTAQRQVSFAVSSSLTPEFFGGLKLNRLDVSDHHVSFLSLDAEAAIKRVFAAGHDISDLEVRPAGLEEALLALTAHD